MNKLYGNFIGKQIGDYTIKDKDNSQRRIKYKVQCNICGIEKWIYNVSKPLIHGTYCQGMHRKIGSSIIGKKYGDYIVVEKLPNKNKHSLYKVKCTICNSVKETYNLKNLHHGTMCPNICNWIIGQIDNDFIITNAYKDTNNIDTLKIDCKCLKCGAIRTNVTYHDFISDNMKNTHGKICTIKNVKHFTNKKLVRKLLQTYQNMNTRIKKEKAYADIKNLFLDSTDFVCYVYDMFEKRHIEENIPLKELSIDRINPFGNYEKGNVRCLTLKEQQLNKRIHWKENVETIENSSVTNE